MKDNGSSKTPTTVRDMPILCSGNPRPPKIRTRQLQHNMLLKIDSHHGNVVSHSTVSISHRRQ